MEECMKTLTFVGAATLFFVLGQSAIYAQQPQDEGKPPAHEEAKPAQAAHPDSKDMKPAMQEPAKQGEERKDEQKNDESKKAADENRKSQEHNAKQDEHQQHGERAEASGKGKHIPEDKFRSSFGRQHTFIIRQPVIVNNRPRFQYSGYWFELVDAWPTGWAYTDDCYIDYVDDGYFLFDPLHPGIRVAIVVVG